MFVDEASVQSEQKDTRVGQHASGQNHVVHVRTGHLDVSVTAAAVFDNTAASAAKYRPSAVVPLHSVLCDYGECCDLRISAFLSHCNFITHTFGLRLELY